MKILVVGGGGREHAIIWKLIGDKSVSEVHCAPGNGGISDVAVCAPFKATDVEGVVGYAKRERFDLVVIAPDDPLYMGMADRFAQEGIRAFGPVKKAAALEGSKSFAKALMEKYGIPTPRYRVFSDYDEAAGYLRRHGAPVVVKADGLALGKGVTVCATAAEAEKALADMMVKKVFGAAGAKAVIEECVSGPEVSVLAFCDGETMLPMASAQDHKRAFDGDEGPNTGGMGAFSPSPKYTEEIRKEVEEKIIMRTLAALKSEGIVYKGVLYFGLMLTEGGPVLLEYNARFGDPEAQAVLPRMKNSLLEVMDAVIDGKLSGIKLEWDARSAVCVVAASGGYPGGYGKGYEITGIDKVKDATVFHAGTEKRDGRYYTSGGRVLGVTALGRDISEAREKAYSEIKKISFSEMMYRNDIGLK